MDINKFVSQSKKLTNRKPIRIKPSEKGSLHRAMGIPQRKTIGRSALAHEKTVAKRTGNKRLMKKVVFAQNFGKKGK